MLKSDVLPPLHGPIITSGLRGERTIAPGTVHGFVRRRP